MNESEIEARLTETLRAVADQTEAKSELGFLPSADAASAPTPGLRPRGLLLVAAAAIAVAAGGGTYLALATGDDDRPDIGTAEPAEEPEIDLDRVDEDGNPNEASPDGDGSGAGGDSVVVPSDLTVTLPDPDAGDPLYLVPADRSGLIASIELNTGSEITHSTSLSMALIGRRGEGTIEQIYVVYQAADDDPFGIDRETSETVAGVELFNSFDEGVIRELDDGTSIIYQTAFGDPALEELVAGVSVVDGLIAFEADPERASGLEMIAIVDRPDLDASTWVIHDPDADPAAPEGPAPGFRLFTTRADDPMEAAVHAADFGVDEFRETTVGDRPGHIFSMSFPEVSVSVLGWSPVDGYAAALIVWGLDEAGAIDLAASMVPVDEETWRTELGG